MSDMQAIGRQLMESDGVKGFVILHPDGRVVHAENLENPETAATAIAFCAMGSVKVKQAMGLSKLLRFAMAADGGEDMLVVPLKEHLAGIVKTADAKPEEVIENFRRIVKGASR